MAYFAELNSNNVVLRVIAVDNNECLDSSGVEQESLGIAFCQNLLGGVWKQTSYNSKIRKNYAGIGYTYDQSRDAFIPPQPYSSWIIDETTCQWKAPVEYPSANKFYLWDETNLKWELKNG